MSTPSQTAASNNFKFRERIVAAVLELNIAENFKNLHQGVIEKLWNMFSDINFFIVCISDIELVFVNIGNVYSCI